MSCSSNRLHKKLAALENINCSERHRIVRCWPNQCSAVSTADVVVVVARETHSGSLQDFSIRCTALTCHMDENRNRAAYRVGKRQFTVALVTDQVHRHCTCTSVCLSRRTFFYQVMTILVESENRSLWIDGVSYFILCFLSPRVNFYSSG